MPGPDKGWAGELMNQENEVDQKYNEEFEGMEFDREVG